MGLLACLGSLYIYMKSYMRGKNSEANQNQNLEHYPWKSTMRAQIPRTWVLSSDWSPESEGVSSADITNSPNTNRIRAAPRPEKLLLPTWCSQREPGNTTHVVGYGPQQGPGKNTKLYLDINPVLYQAE